MLKDTRQISAELIECALRLHQLKIRHKWRLGDQFCVAQDSELFWQTLYADSVYLVDSEFLNLIAELGRKGAHPEEDTEKMIFIPRLEDIVDFCASSMFNLELTVEPAASGPVYRARLLVSPQDQEISEETGSGLRVSALRALTSALEKYLQPVSAVSTLPMLI